MKYNLSYFLKYYSRYYPSRTTLHAKISEKVGDADRANSIKKEIESYIVEDAILEDRIRSLALAGKKKYYIRSKLLQKGFVRNDIEKYIESCPELQDDDIILTCYMPKIDQWIQQGKSKKEIQQKLYQYVDSPKILDTYLSDTYTSEVEQQILTEHLEKYRKQAMNTETIRKKLLQKGFSFSAIQNAI